MPRHMGATARHRMVTARTSVASLVMGGGTAPCLLQQLLSKPSRWGRHASRPIEAGLPLTHCLDCRATLDDDCDAPCSGSSTRCSRRGSPARIGVHAGATSAAAGAEAHAAAPPLPFEASYPSAG